MVRRRVRHEPVAYILGRKGFRMIEVAVDSRVLVPRPESELLVEFALELQPESVLDVGTGSGAVALAIADELPSAFVLATDTSAGAVEVASANAERLGLADRVEVIEASYPADRGPFDLVVANLPYVTEAEWAGLEPDVREHEPREALVAGPAGLEAIEALLGAARRGPRSARGDRARGRSRPGACGRRPGRGRGVRLGRVPPRPGRDRPGRDGPGVSGPTDGHRGARVLSVAREGADAARAALEQTIAGGGVAVFPADTLYGLACDPLSGRAIDRIQAIKGRDDGKPSAILYFSPLAMRELVAGMGPRTRDAAGALLPGPVTLVIANPERRYPLACREDPERLGVRLVTESPLAGAMQPALPDERQPERRARPAPLRDDPAA